VPAAEELLQRLALRGDHLAPHTARLVRLLHDYGPLALRAAVAEALASGAIGAGSVAHILERNRRRSGLKPPLPMLLPDHPGVREVEVSPHNLEDYDEDDDRDPEPER
jgi:hypothetical protein